MAGRPVGVAGLVCAALVVASAAAGASIDATGLTARVPAPVRAACARLAREEARQGLKRIVFCPPLVPSAVPQVIQSVGAADGNSVSAKHLRTGYLVSSFSPAAGSRDGGGHWTFAAGRGGVLRVWVFPPAPLAPEGQRRLRPLRPRESQARVGGRAVTIYQMPLHGQGDGGLYDGHVVVQWQIGATTFQVSMHGYENRARVEAMAAALIREIDRCSTVASRRRFGKACGLAFMP
jgi:hypothetical protein